MSAAPRSRSSIGRALAALGALLCTVLAAACAREPAAPGSSSGSAADPAAAPSSPGRTVALVDDAAELETLLRQRARDQREPPTRIRSHPASTLARELLGEDVARRLMPALRDTSFVYDADCYFRRASLSRQRVPFAELEGGVFEIVTDELGLREDPGSARSDAELDLVIVTGDSHTDGVCANARSFAHLAEAELRSERAARGNSARLIEVWNAGVGGYSFFNYLGVFDRFRARAPRAFVVCVYGGNDFGESARLWRYFRRELPGPGTPDLVQRIEPLVRADSLAYGRAAQAHCQAYALQQHPDEGAVWSAAALAVSEDLVAAARAWKIEPLLVYLPPALDAQPQLFRAELDPISATLGLTERELHAADALADAWIAALAARGIEVLDLRSLLRACKEPAYWRADLHLSERGHALVAAAVASRLRPLLDP